MIEKIVVLILLVVSLLALGNAATTYKRSYYLERGDRINLSRLTDNMDELDRDRLLRLNNHLVTISKSDYGVLRLMNGEFRRAVIWLGLSLVSLMLYVLFVQARAYWRDRSRPLLND